jgi:hypothetical protein
MRYVTLLLALVACDDTFFPPPEGGGAPAGEGWCGVRALFAEDCAACHSANAELGGLDLETDPHAAVVGVESAGNPGRLLVAAGDPGGSLLYRKIAGSQAADELGSMPPGGSVSAATLAVVSDWIAAGADDVCTGTTTPNPGGFHADGWADPAVHGLATKLQTFTDCRTCHGPDLGGGTVGVACDDCHAADWETTCTFCHGGIETDGGAPPQDIDDQDDPALLSFVAHTAHVTESIHAAWDCTTCHDKPTDALTAGHLFDDDTPGLAEVDFAGGLSAGGVYDGGGACSNLYCHGTGRVAGSADSDLPPPTCHGCHPDWTSPEAVLATMSGDHGEHVGDLACSACHGAVVSAAGAVVSPALHVDGAVQTTFPAGFTFVAGRCTGTCHGELHDSVW